MSARLQEPAAAADSRYHVYDRLEIVAALRALIAGREPVTLHAAGAAEFALSMALALDAEQDLLYVDCAADPLVNRRLTQAPGVMLVAMHQGVKLQFDTGRAEPVLYDRRPALRLPLPGLMLRLQRRETFRVAATLTCQVALPEEGQTRVVELRVADLSLGGVALVAEGDKLRFEIGQVLENCRIELNEQSALLASLEVRNVAETTTRSGKRQVRVGCCFVGLGPELEVQVARTVGQLERGRRLLT
jgi:c-di-GMP-binding flagellar brake protein YcgR